MPPPNLVLDGVINVMDKIDKKIVQILQKNARATISQMSEEVSLSMPAVSERVKKLEASGIIKQYTAIINPDKVKKDFKAIIYLDFNLPGKEQEFLDNIKKEPEILECFSVTGAFDYYMKVCTENASTMQELLERIKANKGVTKTQSLIVLTSVIDKPTVELI